MLIALPRHMSILFIYFRNDFLHFPCHTGLCDRFDICFWKERLRVEKTIFNIFAIKPSVIPKKQSMLVCFWMLPEKSTHPQVERASTNHLVPNLCWIEPLGSDGTVTGCRQKSSEFQLFCEGYSFTLLITLYQNKTVFGLMVKVFEVLSFCPKRKCTAWRFWMRHH